MILEVFENVKKIAFDKRRWELEIHVLDNDNKEHVFVASADSGLTWGDGLWFGTREEHDEELAQ